MDLFRKYLGVIWILGGLCLAVFLFYKAFSVLGASVVHAEDYVFWIVIVSIFIPIILGFILFGYYAFKGEYSKGV